MPVHVWLHVHVHVHVGKNKVWAIAVVKGEIHVQYMYLKIKQTFELQELVNQCNIDACTCTCIKQAGRDLHIIISTCTCNDVLIK